MNINRYFGEEEYALLRRAKVGVAGLGGLGSNVLCHLVRSGVERFVGIDFDRVTPGNLNRQFFFADQVGELKSEALAVNLRRINPEVELEFHACRLDESNIMSFFGDCDLVVEALDVAATKKLMIETLLPAGKFIVAASGIAGVGCTNEMRVHKIGKKLYLVGDLHSGIASDMPPVSPRVGMAAAMQANVALALLLNRTV